MKPLKPWLSFADQLEQLRKRGLQVEDEAAALNYLNRLGYYRLSGYWYPLQKVVNHRTPVKPTIRFVPQNPRDPC